MESDGIVFYSRESGNQERRIIDADGTHLRQLTEDGGIDILPSVCPDGRRIVYQSYRTGAFSIWRMEMDGGPAEQLTDFHSGQIFSSAWSWDGQRLAFTRGTVTSDVVLLSDLK